MKVRNGCTYVRTGTLSTRMGSGSGVGCRSNIPTLTLYSPADNHLLHIHTQSSPCATTVAVVELYRRRPCFRPARPKTSA